MYNLAEWYSDNWIEKHNPKRAQIRGLQIILMFSYKNIKRKNISFLLQLNKSSDKRHHLSYIKTRK